VLLQYDHMVPHEQTKMLGRGSTEFLRHCKIVTGTKCSETLC